MSATILLASGSNARGQLASGTLDDSHTFHPCTFFGYPDGTLPTNTNRIINIVGGANHTLVLLERFRETREAETYTELWGSGDGSKGQLGPAYPGASTSVFRPIDLLGCFEGYVYRLVAACWETSFVVLSKPSSDDVLLSMGADDFGDLGVGGTEDGKQTARQVHVVDFGHLITRDEQIVVGFVETGPHHVIVQILRYLQDGSSEHFLTGWGTSRHGQLGNVTDPKGKRIPYLSRPSLVFVEGRPVSCALGTHHTVFLDSSGCIFGIGSNKKNQMNDLSALKDVKSVGCTWNGTYALNANGIFAVGSHSKGQLGRANVIDTFALSLVQFTSVSRELKQQDMACGSEHVLALFGQSGTGAEVWGWGWNEHGNLGIGTTEDAQIPVRIWPPSSAELTSGQKVISIWAGCGTSWIVVRC